MERFYVTSDDAGEKEALITGDEYRHLKHVLRLKTGDRVEVFDGEGKGYSGRLGSADLSGIRVIYDARVEKTRESSLRLSLAQGIPKGDRMDWIVQKATELGVDSIVPLELSRCVVRLGSDQKRRERQSRWQKIALEAAKQSGRLRIPAVLHPLNLEAYIERIRHTGLFLIPWEEGGQPLREFFAETENPSAAPGSDETADRRNTPVSVMIGPEGGMTEEEVEAGRRVGGKVLTLGPRTLRTDTAGLMLLSVLQAQWGDMG